MSDAPPDSVYYKRSHFATQLPATHLYTASHFWLARQGSDAWRVGFTKFAIRMLGEPVDYGFEVKPNTPVSRGQVVGWIEGFKAVSDIFCILEGMFIGANPQLEEELTCIERSPYGDGWIYQVQGQPGDQVLNVQGYVTVLDQTIDRMLETQKTESNE